MKHLKLGKKIGLFSCAVAALTLVSVSAYGTVSGEEDGVTRYFPHHGGDRSHDGHYLKKITTDADHYGWFSSVPSSPGPIAIKYDFRSITNTSGTFANGITIAQKANAVSAMNVWSAATGGKLTFTQDTGASISDIINIGTGNLTAVGFSSGVGDILGGGGGVVSHGPSPGIHSLTKGVAWQDSADTWDTTIGNGNPGGTFDYFTVVIQEIGHALGLGHTTGAADIMNGDYTVEKTTLTAVDIVHITSIYGAIPEPASLILVGAGAMFVFGKHRRA